VNTGDINTSAGAGANRNNQAHRGKDGLLLHARIESHNMARGQPSSFTIRKAHADDARGILDCLKTAFEPYRTSYTPEGFRDTILTPETIHTRLGTMTAFVATDGSGRVIGTVAGGTVNQSEGHLRGMAVLPEWQGCGVAEQLLSAVEDHLRGMSCSRITLDTTEPLQRAVGFYQKHGYRISGKVGDFFGMPLFEYVKEL
jgi:ribosomal protein S18 acetylase RimI-like enzyme